MSPVIDMTGKRFGRLVVLSREPNDRHGFAVWKAICDCGNTTIVLGISLRRGAIRSCSCFQKEIASAMKFKHGHGRTGNTTREYNSWSNMKSRCLRPEGHHIKGYKGITICDRWLNSFENFLEDMGPRPIGETLDRIENRGNYEPGNCRWATPKTQQNNRGRKAQDG